MQWSKIKKRFESQLPGFLKGRLQVHMAGYRCSDHGRGWFVFDGYEIVSVEAPGFTMKVGNCQFSIFSSHMTWELGSSIFQMMNLSIEQAIISKNPLVKGLALLDRRIKKSQIQELKSEGLEPFSELAISIREFAEGIALDVPTCPRCRKQIIPVNKI